MTGRGRKPACRSETPVRPTAIPESRNDPMTDERTPTQGNPPAPTRTATAAPPRFAAIAPEAHAAALEASGLTPQAARQAMKQLARAWMVGSSGWEDAVAALPKRVRAELGLVTSGPTAAEIVHAHRAADATVKLLVQMEDGALVESVIIPSRRGEDGGRVTLCVSSQVGCGRRCAFCATGTMGLRRQLGADEIVGQLRSARGYWQQHRGSLPEISNVVFMGMGEPMDNLDAVCDAIDVMTSDLAFGLAAGRITVSTVGIADRVAQFAARSRAHLALSLHAPDDERRRALMPVHKRTDLLSLKRALLDALPAGRDVLVAYILFAGFNDSASDAALLADWLQDVPARLNLIPANPGPRDDLRAPDDASVVTFQRLLAERGVRARVRWPHGRDVDGACGQLAARVLASRVEVGEAP